MFHFHQLSESIGVAVKASPQMVRKMSFFIVFTIFHYLSMSYINLYPLYCGLSSPFLRQVRQTGLSHLSQPILL
jgi:hypothetical protein